MSARAYCDQPHPGGDTEADRWCEMYHQPPEPRPFPKDGDRVTVAAGVLSDDPAPGTIDDFDGEGFTVRFDDETEEPQGFTWNAWLVDVTPEQVTP